MHAGQAQPQEGPHVGNRQATLDPPSGQEGEGEAGRRNKRPLDPATTADETHGVHPIDRTVVNEGPCDGQARKYVPRRAASGDHHLAPAPRGHGVWRAMLSRIPKATIVTINADPPKETNGSGTPVIGSLPRTAPILTNAWIRIQVVIPAARS